MKKITKATFKKFVRENFNNLHIDVKRTFDGMIDGCREVEGGFEYAKTNIAPQMEKHTLGVTGVWLVGGGRDYFEAYDDGQFKGIHVFNSCGSFTVAVPATA